MKATPLSRPAMDAVFTMCAGEPCSRRIGRKLWMPWTTPQRLTCTTQRQSSRVWSAIWLKVDTPALLHSTSTRPNRSIVDGREPGDIGRVADVDPHRLGLAARSRMPAATTAAASPSRSATTTAEPSATNRSASARPMPLAATGHHGDPARSDHVGRHQPPSSTSSSPVR